jgi:hypothetical protein
VPLLADLMVSRWGFEAIAVEQFKNNQFQKPFFEYEKEISVADFRQLWLDELGNARVRLSKILDKNSDSLSKVKTAELKLIAYELQREKAFDLKTPYGKQNRPAFKDFDNLLTKLNINTYNEKLKRSSKTIWKSLQNTTRLVETTSAVKKMI